MLSKSRSSYMCNVWWISTGEIQVFIRNIDRHISWIFSNIWLGHRWNNWIVLICEDFSTNCLVLNFFCYYCSFLHTMIYSKFTNVINTIVWQPQIYISQRLQFLKQAYIVLETFGCHPHQRSTWASHLSLPRAPAKRASCRQCGQSGCSGEICNLLNR